MQRRRQIELLHSICEKDLQEIKKKYQKSIKKKELDEDILIRIKNLLENLKSILDFTAIEIFEKFCHSNKKIPVTFPILSSSSTHLEINNRINGIFPGLKQNNSNLYKFLIDIQPSVNESNNWLSDFNELCNKNKHRVLSLQIRSDDIINLLVLDTGHSYLWSDGLVSFNSETGTITIKPTGKYAISKKKEFLIEDDKYITNYGWIISTLKNYKQRTLPDLSKLQDGTYQLSSFTVANYVLEDDKTNIITLLTCYVQNVVGLKNTLQRIID